MKPSIVWFRQDLRLQFNLAVYTAIQRGSPILPIYIWSPEEEGDWAPGGASKWWLHQSLKSLEKQFQEFGLQFIFRKGKSLTVLKTLIKEIGADSVFWNRRYEPTIIKRDTEIKSVLQQDGITVETFNSNLLFEPWDIKTKTGTPYKVFSAYWNTCLSLPEPREIITLGKNNLIPYTKSIYSIPLDDFQLEPKINWAEGIRSTWKPGEENAQKIPSEFTSSKIMDYPTNRDIPGVVGTSRLSPYLHFGEISPRNLWNQIREIESQRKTGIIKSTESYLRELVWREFAHHLLYHFPHTIDKPLRPEFEKFPWRDDMKSLKAWQKGETGYPIVDAGMRELWTTGFMHNRVRMITASFLVKDLLLPWQLGAKWFWDTLVDADLANNTMNWQWVAGCGADAAPFFRIFNPVTQGEKFDPDGDYVRKWLPELKKLPNDWIHKPWTAPDIELSSAGIKLDRTYPKPIIDHAFARERALSAFKNIRKSI